MTNTPQEVTQLFTDSAVSKSKMPLGRMGVYSLLGGAYIGLGGLLAISVGGAVPGLTADNPGLQRFIFGSLFPLGLFLVVLAGAELFTSDCASASFGVYRKKLSIKGLARVWTVAYLGNFVGAVLVAYIFAYSGGLLQKPGLLETSLSIGEAKTSASFGTVFIKGIGANWLVCLAVWMAFAARSASAKMLAIWFPVMAFVTLGFEHSIANMFFVPTAIFLGADITWGTFLGANLLPATLGNIVGGAVFVALAYHVALPARQQPTPPYKKTIRSTADTEHNKELVDHLN